MSPAGPRILLFCGKGGVGKTTTAAATALRCADAGLRTVVLSADPAHSLADAFGVPLSSVGAPITERLWGQQLDAQERFEDAWADIRAWVLAVLDWAGVAAIEAEELSLVPGLDEVFALADIKDYASSAGWDLVVVDCAPTAETLRLLSLPDVLGWYMARLFPATRRVNRVVAPVLSRISQLPVAGDEVFAAAQRFYERLDGLREILTDPDRCAVRLVCNPEKVVVAEARRTYTYLSLFGYHVDAVVANRVLPEAVSDPWFRAWKEAHADQLAAIEECFAPLPVLRAELAPEEPVGLERLRRFAQALYGDTDPSAILYRGEPMRLAKHNGHWVMRLALPFAERDDLEVGRRHGELFVRVGPYRRAISLPDSLRRRPVTGAHLAGSCLEITFGEHGDG